MRKIVITAALIALGFTACGSQEKQQTKTQQATAPKGLPVSVFEISDKKAQTNKTYPTLIKPFEEVDVIARVKGVLVAKYFKEGDTVKKGSKLYTIEPDTYLANLNQAKANYYKANKDFERASALLKTKSISEQQFDEYKYLYEDAKAKLQQAQIEFNYTEVCSPIDGIVGIKKSDIGDLVGSNESNNLLVTVTSTNPIHAEFSLSKDDISQYLKQIKENSVQISLISNANTNKTGVIDYIAPKIDSNTDTLLLRAKFDNSNQDFIVGEFATIQLNNLDLGNVFVIPENAIVKTAKGTFVYVAENNQAKVRFVKLGELVEEGIVVKEGLNMGEKIVVSNIAKLRPDTPIQILNQEK
jgi:membrane fusion protein (multidrug efflux system)